MMAARQDSKNKIKMLNQQCFLYGDIFTENRLELIGNNKQEKKMVNFQLKNSPPPLVNKIS